MRRHFLSLTSLATVLAVAGMAFPASSLNMSRAASPLVQTHARAVLAAGASASPARGDRAAVVWHDPSPHKVRYVRISKDVQLEVLDWGGSGAPIILLAGSGDTAHVFDEFAPTIAARHHVYGITRRGYGASGYDPLQYGSDRLGDDVVAVMDALELQRSILMGHSFAGAELSDVATRYPGRIAGLVYLEAAYTFAFRGEGAPTMDEFQQLLSEEPKPPAPVPADLASFTALQAYYERMTGIRIPEAELRQQWEGTADGRVSARRSFPGRATITEGAREFSHIAAPALVVFANPHNLGPWLNHNPDPSIATAVKAYQIKYADFTKRQAKAVADGMPNAHVVTLRNANHRIFLSNQTEVLKRALDAWELVESAPPQ